MTVPSAGRTATYLIYKQPSCAWFLPPSGNVISAAPWMTIRNDIWWGYANAGVFAFDVQANAGAARSGTITAAGLTFVVRQEGAADPLPVTGQAVAGLEGLDSLMTSVIREFGAPGGTLAVSYKGRLVYARGFGYADLSSLELAQPDSLFRLASVSKLMTMAAIAKLEQDGKLAGSSKAFTILNNLSPPPGLAVADPNWFNITIDELVNHTAGFLTTNLDRALDYDFLKKATAALGQAMPGDNTTVIRYAMSQPLDYTPGSPPSPCPNCYSNFGYQILGRVIEKVSGQSYESYVRNTLMAAASVSRTRGARSYAEQIAPGEVKYYPSVNEFWGDSIFPDKPGPTLSTYGRFAYENMDSFGGMLSNTMDLLRFYNLWLNWGPGGGFFGSLPGTNTGIFTLKANNDVRYSFLFNYRSEHQRTNTATCTAAAPCGLENAAQYDLESRLAGIASWPAGDQFPQFSGSTPACVFGVSPAALNVSGSGAASLSITASGAGCRWTAVSDAPWATFAAGSGAGSSTVSLTVAPNNGVARSSVIYVAGTPVPVTQSSSSCSYGISLSGAVAPPAGGSGSIGVITASGCLWTATSNAPWIGIDTFTASGAAFTASANATGAQRSGTITAAGQTFTVTQAANNGTLIPALVSLNPFQGTGANANLTFTYSDPNGWAAIKSAELIINPRWESNARGGGCYVKYAPGTGLFTLIGDDGNSVAGTIAPGAAGSIANSQCSLSGGTSSVTGSGNNLTVVAALTFQASFTGQRHIWMPAADYNNISTNWLVYGVWFPAQTTVKAGPWYRIYDPFSKTYLYSFDKNEYDTLGARGFTQQGISGLVMDGSTTVGGVSNMAWYRVFVNSTNSHLWTSDRNEFLTLINAQQAYVGEGVAAFVMPYIDAQGQVSRQVTNTIPFYRAAFQGQNLHFWTPDADEFFGRNGKQLPAGYLGEGIACYIFPASGAQFSAAEADDGAPTVVSAGNGAITAGEALAIYGRHLGGRVLINGAAAEVISVGENEIRVVAPEGLEDEATLEIEHRGRRSQAVRLDVVRANPRIFGSNQYGRGNARAWNEDGTMNGVEHAAARGSVVTLETTGGGLDLPVEAHVGGRPAEVISRRAVGVGGIEVRIRVPETVEAAAFQPVVLHVGNTFSQPGVGLAIR